MNKYADEYRRQYPKVFGAVAIFILLALHLIARSDKPREEFIYLKGTISYLSQVHPLKPQSAPRPKDVYLILNEHDRIFELFIGIDKGDFSPRLNRLNELKVGDEIEVYFADNMKTKKDQVNRLLQYLDKEGDLYYLRSRVDRYIGFFVLGASGILLILGIFMKLKSS